MVLELHLTGYQFVSAHPPLPPLHEIRCKFVVAEEDTEYCDFSIGTRRQAERQFAE